jgi:hypothetical protein
MYFASALPHLPFPDLRNSKFNIRSEFEFESPLDLYYNMRRKLLHVIRAEHKEYLGEV